MLTRHTLLEKFSSFVELTDHRFSRWLVDGHLKRSMRRTIAHAQSDDAALAGRLGTTGQEKTQVAEAGTQSSFWVIYWYQQWTSNPAGRGYHHLMAFVQESCYWSAHKLATSFANTQYSLSDYFQVAIAGFPKILNSFAPDQGSRLDTYARMAFSNIIRDTLRQRKETDICSDWSLLRKISQKRLQEAIATAGESSHLEAYTLAWQCLKALYVPQQARSTKQLDGPDAQTWEAIVQRFDEQSQQQKLQWTRTGRLAMGPESDAVDATTLQQWLRQCAAMVRSYLYPAAKSLNAPKAGLDSGELQDSIADESADDLSHSPADGLLGAMVAQEEFHQRRQQQVTIQRVLVDAVHQLPPESQRMLVLYYAQHQNQKDIAQALDVKQYTVSRRLGKIRETLLKTCVAWSEKTLHISPTPDVLKTVGLVIDEWLCNYYATQPKEQR